MPQAIYLDHHATTPLDPRVVEAMKPFWSEKFGNPASKTHSFGIEAGRAVEAARARVAGAIGADPEEILWTSGATEANNLALLGALRGSEKKHAVVVQTEHASVLDPASALEAEGFRITRLPVRPDGLVDLKRLEEAVGPETALVSCMVVNNEIGVVQPVREIGALCKERGVWFHSDAAQALGRVALNVQELGVDLLSLSAHKAYGPKGIGALYVRRFKPRVKLRPILFGGGHEQDLRPGTLNVPAIVGFARAVELAVREGPQEEVRLRALRERLRRGIQEQLEDVVVNGSLEARVGGNLNLSFAYVEGESLVTALNEEGIAVSTGSACTTAALKPSHVLKALGLPDPLIASSIRFGLGRSTTEAQIDRTIEVVVSAVRRLRELSPLADLPRDRGPLKTYGG